MRSNDERECLVSFEGQVYIFLKDLWILSMSVTVVDFLFKTAKL